MNDAKPTRLCECGCGNPAPIADRTDRTRGYVKGEPRRFLTGHNIRPKPVRYIVDPKTGCWNWQLAIVNGYGRVALRGRQLSAHRVMYEEFVRPIPAGLVIDHLCRNPACVNPAHLEPVTQAENVRRGDLAETNRRRKGERRLGKGVGA